MYRNYGYGGPPPPRRRVPAPDFSFREPPFHRGYVDPFLVDPWLEMPDPYMARPRPMGMSGPYHRARPTRPRGAKRGGISNYSTQLVNKQIEKATEKMLSQYAGSETEKDKADGQGPSKNSVATDESGSASTSEKGSGCVVKIEPKVEVQTSQDDAASKASQPTLPIGPRIPAKQMWESSYREVVSEKDEAESLKAPPLTPNETEATASAENSHASANKHKQKYNKFKRGPYYKRKKKPDSNNQNETADFETVVTYPRMCTICNVQLTGAEQERIHIGSEIHANNMKNPVTDDTENTPKMSLEKLNETVPLPINTPDCLRWESDTGDRTINTVRFCRLCSVRMTSLQNAKQHYDGKCHAKKIRIVQRGHRPPRKVFKPTLFVSGGQLGLSKPNYAGAYSYSQAFIQAQPQGGQSSIPGINLKPSLPGDFANSMTPSGQYYCQTCKIVIQHAGSLNTHLQSREHKLAKAKS